MSSSHYYELTGPQRNTLAMFCAGKRVSDLGCGSASLSRELVALGAVSVLAVDKALKEVSFRADLRNKGVTPLSAYFDKVSHLESEVAVVSWPVNRPMPGLVRLLGCSDTVIYIGKNVDGTSCGCPVMFEHLVSREILAHKPHKRNTLTVYGKGPRAHGVITGEELASRRADKILSYEEAESSATLKGLTPAWKTPRRI